MDLYRLRVEVPDDPGRIGRVLVALGELAVNIVEIDCHNVDGDVRIDDLFVHATRPIDLPTIAHAVENTGCPLIEIRPLSVHELEDPVTRSMRYITHIATAHTVTDDLITWCAGELVRADLACVIDARVAAADSAASRALAQGVPVHEREWVKRLPSMGVQPWALAMPFDQAGRRAAAVVFRTTSRFTRTETARLRALLDASTRPTPSTDPATQLEGHEPTWDIH
jgi:ACT domain-containing protein